MKMLTAAILLGIALPAAAHAQTSTAPKAEKDECPCCKGEKMMPCCEKMRGGGHAGHRKPGAAPDPHAGHDMSQHGHHQGQQTPRQ